MRFPALRQRSGAALQANRAAALALMKTWASVVQIVRNRVIHTSRSGMSTFPLRRTLHLARGGLPTCLDQLFDINEIGRVIAGVARIAVVAFIGHRLAKAFH